MPLDWDASLWIEIERLISWNVRLVATLFATGGQHQVPSVLELSRAGDVPVQAAWQLRAVNI
jgi:hypothetical protein